MSPPMFVVDRVACTRVVQDHARHTGNLFGIPPTGRDVAYQYSTSCGSATAAPSSTGASVTT